MNKLKLFALLALSNLLLGSFPVTSQTMDWTKQIITINSGRFEFTPPVQDFVTAQAFNPTTQAVNEFNTIFTQSAQDVLIVGNVAYVAAQDSIIKYNLNTYHRITAIADSGLAKLAIFHNRLVVSKQYPLAKFFVEVLDTVNLSLIAMVDHIAGDCGGIACSADTVYVAVNGGWMGTEGKIAVIDPVSWTLTREINLGTNAIGIFNLYKHNGKIFSVNKTPYGMPPTGSISVYDPSNGSQNNLVINVKVGNGTGMRDSTLYFMMNEGIGSFNLNTLKIADTSIVSDPGSAMFQYILSSAIDTLNKRIYANIGDFTTAGYCLVSSLTGDSITSYPTGISSDVVGVDYREYAEGISFNPAARLTLTIYPNPAANLITVYYQGKQHIQSISVTDAFGKTVFSNYENLMNSGQINIQIESLPAGLYCVVVRTSGEPAVAKFIKR